MPKTYTIDQIRLLDTQKALNRNLKKGDFINVGSDLLSQIEQILTKNNIQFVSLPYAYGVHLITIN